MAKLNQLIKKLQSAILSQKAKVKVNTRQFFSEETGRMMTCYSVTVPKWSEEKKKETEQVVLKTCSTVEVVKFLAKMLEELENGPES